MRIIQVIRESIQYLVEASTRLFSPTDDQYPNVGVQPFDGDAYSRWR
jgi:hypothetical protein